MAELIFFFIALSICVFAVLTVTSRHIFHSAVWLSFCLLSVANIYFYLGALFVGVIQVLVYIGGIVTLFIFAIKLTAHIDDPSIKYINKQVIPSILAVMALFGLLCYAIARSPWVTLETQPSLTLKEIGQSLMTVYVLPFEFISLILLAVMVGAIVIGKEKK